jgi:glycosyltransferase involved in cell wall biosynthesis
MEVTYFFRKPQPQYHSIERVFRLVIQNLPTDIQVREYKLQNGNRGFFSRVKALIEVRRNKGSINHITGDISYVAIALPKKGLVVTFHDLESLQRSSGLKSTLLKWFWVTIPARRASVITVISRHTKEQVIKWSSVPEDKIEVIHNPLPEGFIYYPKPVLSEKPLILALGTKQNKNLEGIIIALEGMNCRLLIVGQLNENQLKLLKIKHIEYENLVSVTDKQIIDAYKCCDLLCFPSFFEGFGMPIIEAQATGRPVVTSRYGAMKEVAGEGALLVNPNNIIEIKEGMKRILSDEALRHQLIKKGLKNVEKHVSSIVAVKYSNVYRKFIL